MTTDMENNNSSPDLDLFIRLHQYAFQPGVHRPNPYVDQSKLNLNNYVRDVFGPQDIHQQHTVSVNLASPISYCDSPATSSTWGESPERFQNVPATPISIQSRVPALAFASSEGDADDYSDSIDIKPEPESLRLTYDLHTPVPARRSSSYPPVLMHSSSIDDDYASESECEEEDPAPCDAPVLPSSPLPTPVELLEEAYVDLSPCGDENEDDVLDGLFVPSRGPGPRRGSGSESLSSATSSSSGTDTEELATPVSIVDVKLTHPYAANLFDSAYELSDDGNEMAGSKSGKRLRKVASTDGTLKRSRQVEVAQRAGTRMPETPEPSREGSADESDSTSVYSTTSVSEDDADDIKIIPNSKKVRTSPTSSIFDSDEVHPTPSKPQNAHLRPTFLRTRSTSSLPAGTTTTTKRNRNPVGLRRTASLDDAPPILVSPSSIFGPRGFR
ncbi:hypothetical protein HDV00_011027 [Rhizophlyctis rosea]|nr:hypothetical protein HDV00_011027 [Rhizophlyctis rosea]